MKMRLLNVNNVFFGFRSFIFASFFLCLIFLNNARVFASNDSWTAQQSRSFAWLHAVSFIDARRGFAAGGRGVLLSTTDGGAHWQALKHPSEDTLRDIVFVDEKTGWLICERDIYNSDEGQRTYLMHTTDGGATWTRLKVGEHLLTASLVRIVFADALRGYTFGELGALFATDDGGATWKRQILPTRYLILGGAFSDSQTGALVGANQTALFTEDGGAHWRAGSLRVSVDKAIATTQELKKATAEQNIGHQPRLNAVSFADARNGWAVGANGTIVTTADGGRTWRAQKSGVDADLLDVKFVDLREGWAVGKDGTILHTTDSGTDWETEASGTTHALERICFVGDGATRRGFIVGFGGTILTYNSGDASPQLKPQH
ncbi:MAG: YCF48-related protein [Pyrinomonadaceae bacterium]